MPGQDITLTGGGYTPSSAAGVTLALSGERGNNILAPRRPLSTDPTEALRLTVAAPAPAYDNDARERVEVAATHLTTIPRTVPPVVPANPPLGITSFPLTGPDARAAPSVRSVHGALQGARGDISRHVRRVPFRPVPAGSWAGYRDVVVPRRKAVA